MVLKTNAMIHQEDIVRMPLEEQIKFAKEHMAYDIARLMLEKGLLPVRIRPSYGCFDGDTIQLEMRYEVEE